MPPDADPAPPTPAEETAPPPTRRRGIHLLAQVPAPPQVCRERG